MYIELRKISYFTFSLITNGSLYSVKLSYRESEEKTSFRDRHRPQMKKQQIHSFPSCLTL